MSSFVGSGFMSGPLPPAETRSLTSLQMFHTHTLLQEGGKIKVWTNEMKMRMKEMKMR